MKRLRIGAVVVILAVLGYYVWDVLTPPGRTDHLARVIHLEDRRELSGRLKAFLDHSDPVVRERAALAVGRIGGAGAVDALFPLLMDSVWDVAATAATAIGFTGEPDAAGRLLDAAEDVPPRITSRCIESAGRLADSTMPDIIANLTSYLSHPSPDVRVKAVMALFRSGAKNEADFVRSLYKTEPDDSVKQACLYFLARYDIAAAADVFADYLADPDPFLRSLAVRGMGAVKSEEAVRYLSIALNDQEDRVVAQAIYELTGLKQPNVTNRLERKLAAVENEKLLVELIGALRAHESADGLVIAHRTAATYPTPPIVAATARYAATIQKGRAIEFIDSLLRVDGAYVRAACAEALGLIRQENVLPRLTTLFSDQDPLVRVSAFTTLMDIDSSSHDFYIRKALDDPDFVLQSLGADEVGKLKAASFLPVLRDLMVRREGVDADVRRSIVGAMEPFIEPESVDSGAVQILLLALDDPNYIVRHEAAEVWDKHLQQPRPASSLTVDTRISESRIKKALDLYRANPLATIGTRHGEFQFELFIDVAPLTVINFIELADDGFYDGLPFHRVIPNFVAQGGDPRGDGWGGPDYYIRDEYSSTPYVRGTVGIATSGKDTGGSQFFITLSPQPHLEGRYTVFGQVIYGMEVVDLITIGDVIETIHIHEGKI